MPFVERLQRARPTEGRRMQASDKPEAIQAMSDHPIPNTLTKVLIGVLTSLGPNQDFVKGREYHVNADTLKALQDKKAIVLPPK